jgi:hypothetical protein
MVRLELDRKGSMPE